MRLSTTACNYSENSRAATVDLVYKCAYPEWVDAVEKWLVKARLLGARIEARDDLRGQIVDVVMPVRGGVLRSARITVVRMREAGMWRCFGVTGTADRAAILLSGWAWMYAGVKM